jgi:hypothetical protein
VVDREALVSELGHDTPVAVTTPVLRMHGLDSATLVGVAVWPLAEVVVVCGAGKSACLQEMLQSVLVAQFSDDLGPIPNISAFSFWSRAFNFFR